MAEGTKSRSSRDGQYVTIRSASSERGSKVKFGSVTISGAKPSAASVATNVANSAAALGRIVKTLSKPGVRLQAKKDVPQYWASDGESGVFVRRLNGHTERGRVIDGNFQVLD